MIAFDATGGHHKPREGAAPNPALCAADSLYQRSRSSGTEMSASKVNNADQITRWPTATSRAAGASVETFVTNRYATNPPPAELRADHDLPGSEAVHEGAGERGDRKRRGRDAQGESHGWQGQPRYHVEVKEREGAKSPVPNVSTRRTTRREIQPPRRGNLKRSANTPHLLTVCIWPTRLRLCYRAAITPASTRYKPSNTVS